MGIDGKEHGVKIDWHDSYDMLIREKKSYIESRRSQGDMFYSLFLGDCCLGKQCFEKCKYKYDRSSADIRIGDLWGNTYKDNEDGVSCAIAFTEKGDEVLKHINCELVSHPFSLVAEGQMKDSPKYQSYFEHIMDLLKNDKKTIDDACHYKIKFLTRQRRIAKVKRLFLKYLKSV